VNLLALVFLLLIYPYSIAGTELSKGKVPEGKVIKIDGREVGIWSPEVESSTLQMSPRPKKIKDALKDPDRFFKEDARIALESFQKFGNELRECVASKKWPEKRECLKLERFDFCFGDEDKEVRGVCNRFYHSKFMNDCTIPFKKCLAYDEWRLDFFTECFNPRNQVAMMFSIYGEEAKRRDFFYIRTGYFNHDKPPGVHQISCDFTVLNHNNFQFVRVAEGFFLDRPDEIIIPMSMHNEIEKESNRKIKEMKLKKAKKSK
jgi:hypothetical protein